MVEVDKFKLASTEDILKALENAIEIPSNIISLTLHLEVDKTPVITFAEYAKSKEEEL